MKLLERVVDHDQAYQLLLGLNQKELDRIEEFHTIKGRKLTPSRELERSENCEFIPLVQACMADRRPFKAIAREVRADQSQVAYTLWHSPAEARKLYWAVFHRKKYKDAAACRFWMQHFPKAGLTYFSERASVVAGRAVDFLCKGDIRHKGGTVILAVPNDIFGLVILRLRRILDADNEPALPSEEDRAKLLDEVFYQARIVPDLTSVLCFVYLGVPLLVLHQIVLATRSFLSDGGKKKSSDWEFKDDRE